MSIRFKKRITNLFFGFIYFKAIASFIFYPFFETCFDTFLCDLPFKKDEPYFFFAVVTVKT